MQCVRNAVLPVKIQITRDARHIEHQFKGGLQHKNPVERSGFVRYGLHHPEMG